MKKKIIFAPILLVISSLIFIVLDNGSLTPQIDQLIPPVFFAITLTLCIFFPNFRKYLLIISVTLLILLIITYLFQILEISNWLGSLGFGMLIMIIFSYIPQLIKDGLIEKF